MNQNYFFFLFFLIVTTIKAQTLNQESLISIHAIDNLSDTNGIANPNEGSLVYIRNNNTTYQKYNNGWKPWWSIGETNIDSLNVIVNNFADTTSCCNLYQHVDCGSAATCIGDTLNCGIVVDFNSTDAIVVAPDEYELIQYFPRQTYAGNEVNNQSWFSTGIPHLHTADQTEAWVVAPEKFVDIQWMSTTMCGLSYLGGINVSTLDIVNNCLTGLTAGRVAYEYQPEGCQGNGVQWDMEILLKFQH